jgi:hypothetical protein
MNNDEIKPLVALPLPYNSDDKIFSCVDEETGEIIGEPYSYNDFLNKIENISRINKQLLGSVEKNLK